MLVPPDVVVQLLEGQRPRTFETAGTVKFAEVSWGDAAVSYSSGHVPGSFHVNTDDFEPPPSWKLGSARLLTQFALKYGFHSDDTVIVSAADPTAGFRLAVVLRYMGVRDVRVLNGGLGAWKAAGCTVETQSHAPPTVSSFGAKIPVRPELIDSLDGVKKALNGNRSEGLMLVDTRTWAEFTGETSGYKYHRHKGRIP
ncbi:MAG: thiosulfate sulfurtransferase, partial [Fuerstiella sp.]|nr:thiosulfate sulfurtransferase [Fuerstiella sp.]